MTAVPTRLTDNRKPTPEEWDVAMRLGRAVIRAVDDRDAIVTSRGLDREFCLPDGNWAPDAPNEYLRAYKILRSLDRNEVSKLRLRCQIFSGFSLIEQRVIPPYGRSVTDPIPEDIVLPAEPPGTTLLHWSRLTKHLPKDCIFRPPCALGEIGWLVDGGIVTYDIIVYQERMTLLYQSGVIEYLKRLGRPPRILEIGAGHGALA